jgi:DNA-binding NarL/FixJ family response regulator
MKVLVIDDNDGHRSAAQAQLKDHEVTVVGSYDEGKKLVCQSHDFEVVLVDLLMPASREARVLAG